MERRTILRAGAAASAAPVLAACGDDGPGATRTPAVVNTEDPATTPLAKVTDISVGGAVFVDADEVPGAPVEQGVVITQPEPGQFRAFSRECTHNRCALSDVRDGQLHCFCHNSLYDLATGKNVGGPAPSPLTAVAVVVRDGAVFRA